MMQQPLAVDSSLGGSLGGGIDLRQSQDEDDWEAVEEPSDEEEDEEEDDDDDDDDDQVPDGEEEEEEEDESEYILCPTDPTRMELTRDETQWALALKQAIEDNPEIDNLPDFMYAQYALIDGDNLHAAIKRVQHFQIFREEYGIVDTLEDGNKICQRFVSLLPKLILSVCFNQEEGNYVLVMDIAAFQEKDLRCDADYKTLLGFVYNVGHLLSPDFTAIRQGIFFVIECDGYDWKNLTMTTRRRLWTESLAVYPYKIRQVKYFHTGLYANLAASLMKRFLPVEVYSKVQVGCQFAGRLDTFYAVPTLEVANQRLLERIDKCLRTRYENIQKFQLHPLDDDDEAPVPPTEGE